MGEEVGNQLIGLVLGSKKVHKGREDVHYLGWVGRGTTAGFSVQPHCSERRRSSIRAHTVSIGALI